MIQINLHENICSAIEFFEFEKFFLEKFDKKNDLLIIDQNVNKLFFKDFSYDSILILNSNESIKEFSNLPKIFDFFTKFNARKNTKVYCIGGGTLSDLVGFAASIYKRGIKLILIPTTLLSMSDASIGGKNGINYYGIKNLIGNYYLPEKVLIDLTFLKTLEEKHFLSGLVEIIKISLVTSSDLFKYLYENKDKILLQKPEILIKIIEDSIKLKAHIVEKDFKDNSFRKILNFGHTFGHSFELKEEIPHGFAIAKGINIAMQLSMKYYSFPKQENNKIIELFDFFKIPYHIDKFEDNSLSEIIYDKKNESENIQLVLLIEIGNSVLHNIKLNEIEYTLKNLFESQRN